jgi:hypothetical protein
MVSLTKVKWHVIYVYMYIDREIGHEILYLDQQRLKCTFVCLPEAKWYLKIGNRNS